ncbi:hypothetical protein Rsub_07147 [Raphidocelis subcapitata]|uniref:Secreted protein n=1 Tax=Raphidocelis subcapitata TaxID=307507 RepID=A0A2V0P8H1_9CHLO|nr:hypothetical protein Rsub_07147 [Raphidocelis subcapitata]|eukprot:GBF94160.1 hypothetical protein Rsub_07147 [Raphidocelis subcapitata]
MHPMRAARTAAVLLALVAAGATAPGAWAQAASWSSSSATASSGGSGGGGGAAGGCTTVSDSSGNSCASGSCCSVKQRVTACPTHTTALAEVNGNVGSCCVVLVDGSGAPAAFCAAPTAAGGARQFPAGVAVSLQPDCAASGGGAAGVLSCTAVFPYIPQGFSLPSDVRGFATAQQAPWHSGLPPCGNGAYRSFWQGATYDGASRATTFTVKCA